MSRVAIFVDGANMFYAQREQGWHIDYRSAYQHFAADKEVTGAFYFTAAPPPGDRAQVDKYRRFRTALTYMGYSVIDKEVHIITDKTTGQTKMKGNLDVEMAFKMLTTASQFDDAVLLGVDVDFLPIIKHLQNLGKTVTCVGRRQMTSTEIINTAKFIHLEDLRGLIERRGR